MGIIKARQLVHEYIRRDEEGNVESISTALDHVDLDVEAGDFIAILGHNGSGKSTLAKHINALLLPSEGSLWVDGRDVTKEENTFAVRQTAGMVFQNPDNQIIASVVEEDVGFGPENIGVPTDEIWKRVEESLGAVGMLSYRHHSPNKLSGGQKQRVAIAGVMAMEPKCIVLDEPTAMLDPNGRKEVIRTAHELNRKKGVTIILITHYMEEVVDADKVIVMDQGKVVMQGTPREVFSQMGIHAQRGVSCADCHMPYKSEGGVKYSDHHIQSPLAMIDRTCQVCHRESEETLRNNVYERQNKANEMRNRLETELAKAHVEAKFAWDKGATEDQMKDVLKLIRQAQWRWDFGVASHGGAFHAPQEIQRILGNGLDKAMQARLATAKVLAKLGYTDDVPMPDFSTKEKAQQYIAAERTAKEKFLNTIVPQWVKEAQENNRLAKNI